MARISFEEFVKVWETSSTLQEVADTLNMTRSQASVRAGRHRREGVPLRYFRVHTKVDKLAVLADIRGVTRQELAAEALERQRDKIQESEERIA